MVRITPIYKPWEGHLQGVPQHYLGNLSTIVFHNLLTGMILQVRFPLRNCTYADFNNADARFCKLVGLLVFSVQIGGFYTLEVEKNTFLRMLCVCVCADVCGSLGYEAEVYISLIFRFSVYLEPEWSDIYWHIDNWELGSKYIGNWKIRACHQSLHPKYVKITISQKRLYWIVPIVADPIYISTSLGPQNHETWRF